jgi:HAD superfamily hydrolase (TIGR01509 family)
LSGMATEPPELVIFDCDGVLIDSERLAVPIDAIMLRHFGIEIPESEIIDRFVGRSPSALTEFVSERLGRELSDDWRQPFQHLFREAYERELRPIDGIEAALDQISLPACVASSSETASLRAKLELTGLYERFAPNVFSSASVRHGKPAPDLFLYAAERMGADPSRCAVVEDSQYGVQAARAAGMQAYGYAGGLTGAAALEGPATTVFTDMHELPRLLGLESVPSR